MEMNEERLAAVFRAAATDAVPAASFDHADVVRASRRITARRRSALAGGALAVLAVAGVGVAGALAWPGDSEQTTSAAAPASAPDVAGDARAAAPGPAAGTAPGSVTAAPPGAAAPDTPEASLTAPLGPGDPATCANLQDPQLRALLEEVLPEVAGAPAAAVAPECRPGGERGVNLEVPGGLFAVAYLPPGTERRPPDPDATSGTQPTASGGTVTVISQAGRPGSPAPYEERIDTVAAYLAPRL